VKPRYIIDLDRLERTAKVAKDNADRLGVHLLMALKSFPLPAAFPALAPFLEGVTASGLYEARLGAMMGRDVHVHAPAYSEDEIDDICKVCRHVVFNSISQLEKLGPRAKANGAELWLRVNPGFSSADCLKYDPCCPDSRFGVLKSELEAADPKAIAMVEGVHIHALCEGYADDFAGMVERFTSEFGGFLKGVKYVNLGGGEVVDDPSFATPRAVAAVASLKRCGDFDVFGIHHGRNAYNGLFFHNGFDFHRRFFFCCGFHCFDRGLNAELFTQTFNGMFHPAVFTGSALSTRADDQGTTANITTKFHENLPHYSMISASTQIWLKSVCKTNVRI